MQELHKHCNGVLLNMLARMQATSSMQDVAAHRLEDLQRDPHRWKYPVWRIPGWLLQLGVPLLIALLVCWNECLHAEHHRSCCQEADIRPAMHVDRCQNASTSLPWPRRLCSGNEVLPRVVLHNLDDRFLIELPACKTTNQKARAALWQGTQEALGGFLRS